MLLVLYRVCRIYGSNHTSIARKITTYRIKFPSIQRRLYQVFNHLTVAISIFPKNCSKLLSTFFTRCSVAEIRRVSRLPLIGRGTHTHTRAEPRIRPTGAIFHGILLPSAHATPRAHDRMHDVGETRAFIYLLFICQRARYRSGPDGLTTLPGTDLKSY